MALFGLDRWFLLAPWRTDARRVGRRGERAAAKHLKRSGYRLLARNVELRVGEADLVCQDPDGRTIVIVEVKTRQIGSESRVPIAPEASVHGHKRAKLLQVARRLMHLNEWHGRPVRIDAIAVEWPKRGKPTIRHHVGAIRA